MQATHCGLYICGGRPGEGLSWNEVPCRDTDGSIYGQAQRPGMPTQTARLCVSLTCRYASRRSETPPYASTSMLIVMYFHSNLFLKQKTWTILFRQLTLYCMLLKRAPIRARTAGQNSKSWKCIPSSSSNGASLSHPRHTSPGTSWSIVPIGPKMSPPDSSQQVFLTMLITSKEGCTWRASQTTS